MEINRTTQQELLDETILEMVEKKKFYELKKMLSNLEPADIAEIIYKMEDNNVIVLFRLLPFDLSIEVFEYLDIDSQKKLINNLRPKLVSRILNEMSSDDRTAFLEYLTPDSQEKVLRLLSEDERRLSLSLLHYNEGTVGRIMTTDFIAVKPEWTVGNAFQYIRENAQKSETLEALYVTDEKQNLIGDLLITQLLIQEEDTHIFEIMNNTYVALDVTTEQQEAVNIFSKYHRVALPVTEDGVLKGIVTMDDILSISTEEDTEDMQKLGGSEALEEPYLEVSVLKMVEKRAGWLIVLFIGEMLTATAMGFFEDEIAKAVVLALFVPLIISSGGNSGSQATTLIIRAMALGEVRLKDWWKVMKREIISGIFLGAILGVIGFARISLWSFFSPIYGEHWLLVAFTVGFSLVGVVLWGALSGSMLPFVLKSIKLDPATSSAPFVATLVDVTGLIIYFSFAYFFLKGSLL